MYLDSLTPSDVHVGYGALGVHDELGYEGKKVQVAGEPYGHAISGHAPSRVVFKLGGRFGQFTCRVALNDDVRAGASHADFIVRADGKRIASESYVVSGDSPRVLAVNITGADELELVTETTRWEYSHSVWLDPTLSDQTGLTNQRTLIDPLGRVEITLPEGVPSVTRCIATVVSPGFETWVDNMLGSLRANCDCRDTLLTLFAVDADAECERIARKHDALLVHCRRLAKVDVTVKAVLYAVALVIDAEEYVCLDADMLVFGNLESIFASLKTSPPGSVLVCREANYSGAYKLGDALRYTYFGSPADLLRLLDHSNGEAEYPLVVNDGIFAGKGPALRTIDGVLRRMAGGIAWMEERRNICWWRNQFLFNLALATLNCGVQLDDLFNVQLHTGDVDIRGQNGTTRVFWKGRPVNILHFCGIGKRKYRDLHGLYIR